MAVIYREDWTPGNSLFSSMYRYDKPSDGADPLYPFMYSAEGVHVDGDGMLDFNPAWMGPFEERQQSGVWMKGAGPLSGGGSGSHGGPGFWDGTIGCIEALFHPTTLSLSEVDEAPLITVTDPSGGRLVGVDARVIDQFLVAHHFNEGDHDRNVDISGAPMPVAGEPYKVRIGWQCGTWDDDALEAAPDGFMRIWINDELIYEATLLSLKLNRFTVPVNRIDSAQFGYAGLLGPLEYFTINDSACSSAVPLPFKSGVTERPLAWMEITRKELP